PTCHHLQKHQGESRSDEESSTMFPTGSDVSETAPTAGCAPFPILSPEGGEETRPGGAGNIGDD
ncbi:MAG TPA: hypothetical protein VHD63_28685, partial [Ktedonobacteraceae bacterium]|nr:hypothetical protein [Ktedonobacteraceae bacterium]